MKAIINATIYDFERYKENQYILFNNKIVGVGPMSKFENQGYDLIDADGSIVMPGLVNGHSHIYSTFARGMSVPFNPENFQEVLDQLWWKLDRQLDLQATYYSGIVSAINTVKAGVTTVIDHHASGKQIINSLWKLKKAVVDDVGLRGIFCFETSDRFDIDQCIKENMDFINGNQTTKCRGLFGLHAAMSLSDETLEAVSKVIGNNPIHIHVAESFLDEKICMERHRMRIIERLDYFGLLNDNSLLAHCLYVDQDEAKLIKDRNCKVVLNVTSNMNNGVGLPDYDLFKHLKINVLVGNDGISPSVTKEYMYLYYGMHLKYHSSIGFSFEDLISCINDTYEYASDILGCKLGRIEEGYEADMLIHPYIAPTPLDEGNVMGHVFFGLLNDFKPSDVWCEGRRIVEGYQVKKELMTTYKEAQNVAQEVWNHIEGSNL